MRCCDIAFADADAFVRGTERFLFASTGNTDEISQPTCLPQSRPRAAGSSRSLLSMQSSEPDMQSTSSRSIRLSNCAGCDAPRAFRRSGGQCLLVGCMMAMQAPQGTRPYGSATRQQATCDPGSTSGPSGTHVKWVSGQ